MPIASPEVYAEMIDRAKAGAFRLPGDQRDVLADPQRGPAGIRRGRQRRHRADLHRWRGVRVRPDDQEHDHGCGRAGRVRHEVAKNYPINIALHTDHCPKNKLDSYVRPLIAISQERVNKGLAPLFQSHMWDGSAVPLDENLQIAEELLAASAAAKIILEIEVGVVGGEEDGVSAAIDDKLYSTVEDGLATAAALGLGEKGRYLTALTFGNVHGVYKPGNVKLRPEILKEIQDAIGAKYGKDKPLDLVFHGGSGSLLSEIHGALDFGVVKMNIDTDTQYAFTRPVVDHIFHNYDGVLKVDGEVGNKKAYDPRAWGKLAENGLAKRVVEACEHLRSSGTTLSK